MKKFNMLIEAIYFGTSPKIFKDFKLKIETEGLDAFGKIHKTLNASKNISLTKWDDQDFATIMDALVKYCQTHEKDERNPYRHHLLAYLGDMTTEGFDRAIYFWKKDREDYIILKTLYRIFTPAERTEFHRLFPTVCEWLNEQLKKHNEADLKTMAVAQS